MYTAPSSGRSGKQQQDLHPPNLAEVAAASAATGGDGGDGGDGIHVVDRKKFCKGNCSCRADAGAGGRAWFGNGLVGEYKMERRISCFVIHVMEPFKP